MIGMEYKPAAFLNFKVKQLRGRTWIFAIGGQTQIGESVRVGLEFDLSEDTYRQAYWGDHGMVGALSTHLEY